jgi:hypothetical protein
LSPFYRAYPQIVRTLSAQFRALVPDTLMSSNIVSTAFAPSGVPAEQLLNHLSYSQFELLIAAEELGGDAAEHAESGR